MSRHRNVKNMIEEDYYDDDYDDDYYDDYDDYGGYAAPPKKAAPKKNVAVKPKAAAVPAKKQQPQNLASKVDSKTKTTVVSCNWNEPPPAVPDVLKQDTSDAATITKTPKAKIPLTVVILGHVDAGKSTVTGNLLYGHRHNNNNKRTTTAVNYAWLLDEDEQERAHGVTMDIATKQLPSHITSHFQIVLQDAPGHSDYIPAMITGTAAADACLICVDATDVNTALRGGLREHAYLAKGLGVNQMVVGMNKMDLVGWDNQAQYKLLSQRVLDFLKQVGYHKARCVPLSGTTGINIFGSQRQGYDTDEATTTLRSWYKGPTLVEALDSFDPPIKQQQNLLEKPVRIIVTDVLEGSGSGVAVRAKVAQGWAKQGEPLVVLPVGDETTLTKLSSLHEQQGEDGAQQDTATAKARRQYCVAGEMVDCTVTNIDSQRISTGSILTRPNNRPIAANRCRAKIFVLDGLTIPLIRGAQAIFHMHHLDIPCHLAVLVRTLKPDGTTTLKERPRALTKSCNAIVEVLLSVPVCIEAFSDCRALGKFVLRRAGQSIAVGRIEEVMLKK